MRGWLIGVVLIGVVAWGLAFDAAVWYTPSCGVPEGALLHYSADGHALDMSGNARHGTWFGTVAYTSGVLGQAFLFGGGDTVQAPTNIPSLFAGAGRAWSVAAWVLCPPGAANQIAFGQTTAGGTVVRQLLANYGVARIGLTVRGVITTATLDTRGPLWHHFAVTWDGSVCVLYINGASNVVLNVGTAVETPEARFDIGHQRALGVGFIGAVDELRLYGRALSATEVLRLFEAERP